MHVSEAMTLRIGMSEVLVILLAALILFGPSRLPEMGKALGKAIREFRRATTDLGRELDQAREEVEQAAGQPKAPTAKPEGEDRADGAAPPPAESGEEPPKAG